MKGVPSHSRHRRVFARTNRVLLDPRTSNLGNTNILTSTNREQNTPISLVLVANQSGALWDLVATWGAPSGATPTGYSIEFRQINDPVINWGGTQTVTGLTHTFSARPEGIYQVRVRANYAGSPSEYVFSNTVNAFINLSFNANNTPHFHTVMFF